MRVFRNLDDARAAFGPCALTIGNFDGCHIGHQSIFRQVRAAASAGGWKAGVLTFDPHPAVVVAPERAPQLLSAIDQRIGWMAECGIDEAMVLPFDRRVASLDPDEFVRQILLDGLRARAVMVGDNFRFGRGQAGNVHTLSVLGEQHGFEARALHAVTGRGVVVSSSEIRRRLLAGAVGAAARMLGRFYSLEGRVVKGQGVGSRQTVPTLNLEPPAGVLPASGVYVTRAFDADAGRAWRAITNIGVRPTFGGDALTIETYLLSPLEGDPPERLRVEFTHRIREERKFANPAMLREQILKDAARAAAWHRHWERYNKRLPAQ
jgi:riboflavin kinase/FMN adenylyltransferase